MIQPRSWILTDPGRFVPDNSEEPILSPMLVRLRPAYCGICGSDLHSYKGKHPMVHPPIILGHEISATISEVGSETGLNIPVDSPVVVLPSVPCGECYQCRHGREHICSRLKVIGNVGLNGALSHYVDVPARSVVPIPPDMDLARAALVEPTAVAVHALKRMVYEEGGLVIIGAGPIGLLTALVAKAQGIDPVSILDIRDGRLRAAQNLGLDNVLKSTDSDLVEKIYTIHPDGPGAVYDCVAVSTTINLALNVARKGTSVVLAGVPEDPLNMDAILIQDRELTVVGTLMYNVLDFQEAIELIYRNRIPDGIVTKIVPFEDVPGVFSQLAQDPGEDIKVLIKISN